VIVNRTQLAEIFDVTQKTISDWEKEGMPCEEKNTTRKGNKYDTKKCIDWRYDKLYGRGNHDIDYNEERARKTKEEADKLERERLRDEGETLNTHAVIEWVKSGDQKVRTKLLSIPSRCAPLVVGQKVAETENILEGIIHETLQELSDPVELPDCCKV
jgi:phage terminase Nu1 subunit (DNA packaging protein)